MTCHINSFKKYVLLVRQKEEAAIARENALAATIPAGNIVEVPAMDIKRPLEIFVNAQTFKGTSPTLSQVYNFLRQRGHKYNDKIALPPDIEIPKTKQAVVKVIVKALLKIAKVDANGNQDASGILIFKEICRDIVSLVNNVNTSKQPKPTTSKPSFRSVMQSVPHKTRAIEILETLKWDPDNTFPFT